MRLGVVGGFAASLKEHQVLQQSKKVAVGRGLIAHELCLRIVGGAVREERAAEQYCAVVKEFLRGLRLPGAVLRGEPLRGHPDLVVGRASILTDVAGGLPEGVGQLLDDAVLGCVCGLVFEAESGEKLFEFAAFLDAASQGADFVWFIYIPPV
ncbi:MAG: hypothetical protein ACRD7E_27760 [Bryobacteraceae bacterium]